MRTALERVRAKLLQQWSAHRRSLAWLFLLQFIVYGYFFTSLTLTDHTFPNSWVFPYPSYRTTTEGRWFADLLLWLQGGSGVQPFQMAIAIGIQSLNGVLFARSLGLHTRAQIVSAGALLCLYPAFLDYYSFASDHVAFTVGDSFVLLALWSWRHAAARPLYRRAGWPILLFVLALATYPPKLALIAVLCLAHLLERAAGTVEEGAAPPSSRALAIEVVSLAAVVVVAGLAYLASTRLTMTSTGGFRVQINSIPEMIAAAKATYPRFASVLLDVDYLPRAVRFLPAVAYAIGSAVLLRRAAVRSAAAVLISLAMLVLLPFAVRVPYLVNRNTWESCPRIAVPHGYLLVFFLAWAARERLTSWLARGIGAVLLYFFVVVATQETHAATLKTTYELGILNRIAARIESVVADLRTRQHPVVVIGHYPEFARSRYVAMENASNRPHAQMTSFEVYRQPEILNFLFGGDDVVLRPTRAQAKRALASAEERSAWPAADSVYLLDDTIVVVLEKYRAGIAHTSTVEELR